MFTLKKYQRRVLQRLQEFFTAILTDDVATAFLQIAHIKDENGKKENPYAKEYETKIKKLESCPHICVRIPTGGGKTFMAANSLKILQDYRMAANPNIYLAPAVLWIVPSDAIRQQTTEMLTNPTHPCRQTIDEIFGEEIRILDIADFDNLTVDDITDNGFIIISTAAMFRVRQTARNNDGMTRATRRIYASHENFYAHFSSLLPNPPPPPEADAAGLHLEYNEDNRIKHSFANLLHLLKPIVVCDEAHNFISDLSQEVLRRINPSCIMEWTATPRNTQNNQRHNLLVSVSAQELKDEEMVKLPFKVIERRNWEDVIHSAVLEQKFLTNIAAIDRQVRPIVLYKASPERKNDTSITVSKLKKHLIDVLNINETEIAIATGEIHELNGIDLLSPNCPINHIITIEALREGWDCPFAYIFCSVDNIRSETAIEQFLGRIMRMPFAKKQKQKELNCAYVHLPAEHSSAAVEVIREKLSLYLGFDEQEAIDMVQYREPNLLDDKLFELDFNVYTEKEPDFSSLTDEEQKEVAQAVNIELNPSEIGGFTANINAPISLQAQEAIIDAVAPQNQPQQRQRLRHAVQQHAIAASPASKGISFAPLPKLMFYSPEQDKEVYLSTETLYEVAEWNNLDEDCILSEFRIQEEGNVFHIQLRANKMQIIPKGSYTLPFNVTHTTRPQLVGWLKTRICDPDGRFSSEMLEKLINTNLDSFINQNKHTIEQLACAKYQLANELRALLNKHIKRISDATTQQFLLGNKDLKCDYSPHFLPDDYPCGDKFYNGAYHLSKHYYGKIGELDNEEETACAKAIDDSQDVKHWIRNMERQKGSYFLPLNEKHNFYPDFIVELNNGKFLIVEYKGAHLLADAKHKKHVGQQMERVARDKCFFVMVSRSREQEIAAIYDQITQKIKEIM